MSLVRMQSATLSTCSSENRSAGFDNKVCVTCGTDKTPMWRANTDGRKNLCNACGVRLHREQKKAKIARSGSAHSSGRQSSAAEQDVELLPRSRSKQLSPHVVARGLSSSQAKGSAGEAKQLQRKRSWQESLDPRRELFESPAVRESGQMELLLPRKSSQQFLGEWRRVASLPQPRSGVSDTCRLTHAMSLPYHPAIASAELDPLDPAFLASINDPCCARKDSLSYHLDASNSCVTETDSEQTLISGAAQHDDGKRMRALDPFGFTSRAGHYALHNLTPTGPTNNHMRAVQDLTPHESHLWMAHGASFLDI